ncbi:unnamed protein product [Rotaria sordida]|uniref:Uncharacterized protein n=1 Tax=Rotaria sordida TaxID=392033 RepID=A0A819VRM8_9BILA|nr:unnamed protein product [Rotaria sordida]CAF4113949.1 unnamed protein product [Rotaria sordida]
MEKPYEIAQQLINNEIQVNDLVQINELESLCQQFQNVVASSSFTSPSEREMASCIQINACAWVDTIRNCLGIAISCTCIAHELKNANSPVSLITTIRDQGTNIYNNTKQIYERARNQAITSSNVLLHAIEQNEKTRCNPEVQAAAIQYKADVERCQRDEVPPDVPNKSHEKLVNTIRMVERDPNAFTTWLAETSSLAWKITVGLGTVLVLVFAVARGSK